MRLVRPSSPIEEPREVTHFLDIRASRRLQLPRARLELWVCRQGARVPQVISARLEFALRQPAGFGEAEFCDEGMVVVETDDRGRIAAIAAMEFAPGPRSAPGAVATLLVQQPAMLHALATIWIQWLLLQAWYAHFPALPLPVAAQRHPTREWMMTASTDPAAEQVW